jgi:pimeloyl-ACP methyl ester carboxylesterase
MYRILKFIFFIILITCLGCNNKENSYPVPPADAKADSYISEAKPFTIGAKQYDADYGTITVQENRNKSSSRLINLPFLRVHSPSKEKKEPIFLLSGGPGASNMYWDWKLLEFLLADHDIVNVGYRGADGSTILECPEIAEIFTDNDDLLGDKSMRAIAQTASASAQRFAAEGIDLDGYTMLEVIDDNESVCKALGYERINLLSSSYGTRVAYLYGLKYPKKIFRSAMIGVNPPGRFVWEPAKIDELLRRFSVLWSQDTVMSAKSKNLYASMQIVLDNMPRKWLFFSIDPGKVKIMTFVLLFSRNSAPKVFDAYIAAENSDPSGLALMSIMFDYMAGSMFNFGDLFSKAVSADFDSTRNYCMDMEPPDMPLGSPLSKLFWGPMNYYPWPVKLLPEAFRKPRPSDVETLLMSGSMDISTPAEFATNDLLPYLRNGKQIIMAESGHMDIQYLNIENTKRLLTGFYHRGIPDASMNTYVSMDFAVKWGFPKIAKIAIGGIVFILMVLVAVIIWIIKIFRKRRAAIN